MGDGRFRSSSRARARAHRPQRGPVVRLRRSRSKGGQGSKCHHSHRRCRLRPARQSGRQHRASRWQGDRTDVHFFRIGGQAAAGAPGARSGTFPCCNPLQPGRSKQSAGVQANARRGAQFESDAACSRGEVGWRDRRGFRWNSRPCAGAHCIGGSADEFSCEEIGRSCAQESAACRLWVPRIHRCGRLDQLWCESPLALLACRFLRRQDFQGGEAWRPAHRTADQIRAGDQPQDRQGARAHRARQAARARRRGDRVRRREFITLLGGAAATWPLAARAQQPAKPARLGYIWIGPKDSEHSTRDGLRQGLRDLGYVEGRDYVLEERYAESQPDRLPGIIAELLQLRVALFLSPGVQVTGALVAATSTVPIIATTPDLLASGFVTSLARPGGNVTGMSLTAGPTLSEKWLEILKETFPSVATVAMLTASRVIYRDRVQAAAEILGLKVRYFPAQVPQEIDRCCG